jgi:DNA-binding Lrp family transcriptional regulator
MSFHILFASFQSEIHAQTGEEMKMSRFLASVNIFADTSEIDQVIAALQKLESIEEVYEVAGEYDIVTLVSTSTLEEFRDLLQKQIMKIKGVKSTISTIILQRHKGPRSQQKTSITSTN